MGRGFKKRFFKFQSTRPRGRTRPDKSAAPSGAQCFNPRVLAGGRDQRNVRRLRLNPFQSTRPRGGTRQLTVFVRLFTISFNPRVLAGGRDSWWSNVNCE